MSGGLGQSHFATVVTWLQLQLQQIMDEVFLFQHFGIEEFSCGSNLTFHHPQQAGAKDGQDVTGLGVSDVVPDVVPQDEVEDDVMYSLRVCG